MNDEALASPRSRPQQLQDALYGDLSYLPPMHASTAEAAGLCGRILVLAERYAALGQQSEAACAADAFYDDRGAARYKEWLRDELLAAAQQTGKIASVGFGPGPGRIYLRPLGRFDQVELPVDAGAIDLLSSRPRFWENDAFYIGSAEFYAEADEALQSQISGALQVDDLDDSEEARYDLGYRDALQSVMLAAVRAGVSLPTCRELVATALDAHANNAPEFESARPS